MIAIEKKIKADAEGKIEIEAGKIFSNKDVRVIVLTEEEYEDISDEEWLKAASHNPVFDFLHDEPDIYTFNDGIPYKRPTEA